MKAWFLSLSLALTAFSSHGATLFGDNVDKTTILPVAQVLKAPQTYLDKVITIEGTVDAVCDKMGCWMRFVTPENSLAFRIKVRDGDMEFPLSAKGKTAYATGTLRLWPQGENEADAYQLYPTAVEITD